MRKTFCVAEAGHCPGADCALMLQCIQIVQEVYLSQSIEDSVSYVKVKSAVLKAFRLVFQTGLGKDVTVRLVLNMSNFIRWLCSLMLLTSPLLKIYVN